MAQVPVTILGIESSCDETAAAVVRLENGAASILSDIIWSQNAKHAPYGGIVPEIAARAHVEAADHAIKAAMDQAGVAFADLDAVAATAGPGLIGGVLVGLTAGKAIALAANKPFIAINHLEGHALSARLSRGCPYPFLLLLVSGGHCQLLAVEGLGHYKRYGATLDDAAGEAFDKAARVLGLGFPGGPALEKAAMGGDPKRYALPRPLLDRPTCDFSFAGLKSAVIRLAETEAPMDETAIRDAAASAQAAIADILADRTARAMDQFALAHEGEALRFVVAGGVAANQTIRTRLQNAAETRGFAMSAPPLRHCTDNAAMIALAGAERFLAGQRDDFSFAARPRWPLDEATAADSP
ncbi:MAG: tRNA (adenosine(37)-N6)-threonylcarbamoyltransferase complex transferase subunit TsaD, partial [Caulobacterales bacterium]